MYITKHEVALHSYEDATTMAKILLENGYVTMISREEQLYIVNYVWSPNNANRNDVAFMDREELEDIIFNPKEND